MATKRKKTPKPTRGKSPARASRAPARTRRAAAEPPGGAPPPAGRGPSPAPPADREPVSASILVSRWLGLAPSSECAPAAEPFTCCLCGATHPAGSPRMIFSPADTFQDVPQVIPGQWPPWACGACSPLLAKSAMQRLGRAVIGPAGAYSLGRIAARKWFFSHLPEPPYVLVHTAAKSAHLIWMAAPTLDNRAIRFRATGRDFVIRGHVLPEAEAAAQRLLELAGPSAGNSPFASCDPALAAHNHGAIRRAVAIAGEESAPEDLGLIESLNPAEVWALGALLSAQEATPPEPIDLR